MAIQSDYPTIDAAVDDYKKWHSDPDASYSDTIDFDFSDLEPQITHSYKADQVNSISEMAGTHVDQNLHWLLY